tara:strand:+ start:2762 stop:3004 length:243 start_codon:yes stop_codon:yes gene_type:complete
MEMELYILSELPPTLQDVIDEMMSMNNRVQSVFNMPDEVKDDVEKTTIKLCKDIETISNYVLDRDWCQQSVKELGVEKQE